MQNFQGFNDTQQGFGLRFEPLFLIVTSAVNFLHRTARQALLLQKLIERGLPQSFAAMHGRKKLFVPSMPKIGVMERLSHADQLFPQPAPPSGGVIQYIAHVEQQAIHGTCPLRGE